LAASAAAQVKPLTTFYWQLQGQVNTTFAAKIYDVDLFDNSASLLLGLRTSGHLVICYFSAGTFENWRGDAVALQLEHPDVIGRKNGWPGERWLDVRSQHVRDMMVARLDTASSKGCDAVEPDNVDGYGNNIGFPLTQQDSIDYDNFLANEARARKLYIAFKNSAEVAANHTQTHDFAIVEECFKYDECDAYTPFAAAGKAVIAVEYSTFSANQCADAKSLKFTLGFYNLALDGKKYQPC
jgi:hypothetical protein